MPQNAIPELAIHFLRSLYAAPRPELVGTRLGLALLAKLASCSSFVFSGDAVHAADACELAQLASMVGVFISFADGHTASNAPDLF